MKHKWEDPSLKLALGKNAKPYLKNNLRAKRMGLAQVVEYLPTLPI
jgi:hypothetical protein